LPCELKHVMKLQNKLRNDEMSSVAQDAPGYDPDAWFREK